MREESERGEIAGKPEVMYVQGSEGKTRRGFCLKQGILRTKELSKISGEWAGGHMQREKF